MNLYTKFEVSILNCCGDIFDEKSGEKEKGTNTHVQGRTNWRMPIRKPTIQLVVVNPYTKFEISISKSCGDIFDEKSGDRKKKKYREEQIGKGQFSIQRYNLSL